MNIWPKLGYLNVSVAKSNKVSGKPEVCRHLRMEFCRKKNGLEVVRHIFLGLA